MSDPVGVGGGGGAFWPHGNNLNNLGSGPLYYAPNIKGPGLLVSDKELFEGFLYASLYKTCRLRDRAIFGPRAITNYLGRGPLCEAMYHLSKAWAFCFQTRRFLKFFSIWVQVKQVTPGAGPFFTPGL